MGGWGAISDKTSSANAAKRRRRASNNYYEELSGAISAIWLRFIPAIMVIISRHETQEAEIAPIKLWLAATLCHPPPPSFVNSISVAQGTKEPSMAKGCQDADLMGRSHAHKPARD